MCVDAIDIVYEEGPVVVLNKPPGILTQGPPGVDSLESQLKAFLKKRDGVSGEVYLGIIHRLDRPASGAIVFTKDKPAAKKLSKQFEQRRVAKTYWAFVEGDVLPQSGTWRDQVYKVHGMAQAEVVAEDHPHGKHAILHYHVLVSNIRGSWLEIELETGRTHQIRLQASTRGHAIHGDMQYGATQEFGTQHEDIRRRAIALHARQLAFTHPSTREAVEILAPPPSAWDALELPIELFT